MVRQILPIFGFLLVLLLAALLVSHRSTTAFVIHPSSRTQQQSGDLSYALPANRRQHSSHRLFTTSLSNDEISRYSRHLVLSDVGVKGQEALKNARVLVIGAGGLGSPALLYLAAAGVGQIGIVDGDTVDESNLQRQIIHSVETIGVSKCVSAQQRIREINPHVNVRIYEEEFTSQTAERIVGEGFASNQPWDVVIDGSDNFPTKYLIK